MLKMADAIYPQNLPDGFDAYLGYVDGFWPDFGAIRQRFPNVPVVGLTVYLANQGDGMDVEKGDATPDQGPTYVAMRHAAGVARPILYASASIMADLRARLDAAGIARPTYRLISAHYGMGPHICSTACGFPIDVDGTQWSDQGGGGTFDESLLRDDFFGAHPPYPGFPLVYPPLRTTNACREWQTQMQRRGWQIGVDGSYGPVSKAVCIAFQREKGLRVDGIVGPSTWLASWVAPIT